MRNFCVRIPSDLQQRTRSLSTQRVSRDNRDKKDARECGDKVACLHDDEATIL
jgi:hypothetical protein